MKTYFRLLTYIKPYWKHLSLSIICTILYALLNGVSVYLSIPLLDSLFQESGSQKEVVSSIPSTGDSFIPGFLKDTIDSVSEQFNAFLFSGTQLDTLLRICLIVLIAFMLKNIFGYLQSYFLAYVEQGVMKDLRNQAYMHLHKLPMSYFKNERVGNLISRLTNDVAVVLSSVSVTFFNMIREPLSILVFLGIALSISWKMTIFALLILPFSMIVIGWIGIKLRTVSTYIQEKMADITSVIQETISGVKVVKAFSMEEFENKKFHKETNKFFRLNLRITRIRNFSSPITEILSVIIGVIIIYYGGQLVLVDKSLKASEFLGFLFAIFQLMPPIKELSSVNNRIQESSAAGDRIFEIIDTKPEIKDVENPLSITNFNKNIVFENVSFHYDDSDELILKNISFEVKKGEVVAFVGPSGAGKSTLIDLLPRFFDPSSGKIMIDGNDIKEIKIEDLRKLMGIVTQETILFNESIKNNIAYGLEEFPLDAVIEAAKTANAHGFITETTDGYNTIIGERGLKLSGGQRQRLSIARALLKDPQIMIFDEATSSLDNESEILVQEAIERLMTNRTTFVIAHRLSTIRNATKIIVIDEGKIVQTGTHDELVTDEKGLYRKFYEMQFRG
ncbi:MAG TPA: ABC transporter ATP-binding protein [Ignavibacteriaceae bacterium]|nr:ABC transporter ATP-binding protein [Ignavibacteriaceae bacterium]HOJ18930.1 ABC transporter ATP-binding protein [Ignavibacteriaceae bacterium]